MKGQELNICKKRKTVFGWKNWNKPTPSIVRKYATAISTFLASVTLISVVQEYKWLSCALIIIQLALEKLVIPLFGTEETTIITTKNCDEVGAECPPPINP